MHVKAAFGKVLWPFSNFIKMSKSRGKFHAKLSRANVVATDPTQSVPQQVGARGRTVGKKKKGIENNRREHPETVESHYRTDRGNTSFIN